MRDAYRAHGIAIGIVLGGILARNGIGFTVVGAILFVLLAFFFEWAAKTGRIS